MQKTLLSFLLLTPYLFSQPSGMNLVEGDATACAKENALLIESSNQTVIEWDTFSIQPHEVVRFQQSGSTPCVLNQVTGKEQSDLLGTLISNGKIFLINPHGFFIGPSASIETAGFIASTLDVLIEDFLNRRALVFEGQSDASILHLGKISSKNGEVFLIAKEIESKGEIQAHKIGLLSTDKVLIQPEKAPHFFFRDSKDAIEKSDLYTRAISHSGKLDANVLESKNGEVYLVTQEGIEISGEITAPEGLIKAMGSSIVIEENATLDVSSLHQAGEIYVGGAERGVSQKIPNAKHVFVSPNATINAQSLNNGDGGKVIFWADKTMRFYGMIDITGGEFGGDGGFAEVSAKHLDYQGITYGLAPQGKAGTLLLDPNDIVIGAAATTGSFSACGPPSNYVITTATATNQILNTDLVTQLATCSVTISTVGSAGAGPNGGSITVSSPVIWSDSTTLTLEADATVTVSSTIQSQGLSSAGTGIAITTLGNAGTHGLSLTGTIQTAAGSLSVNATANAGTGILLDGSGTITTESGAMTLSGTASTGNSRSGIYLSSGTSTISSTGSGVGLGSINITANGGSGGSGSNNMGFQYLGTVSTVDANIIVNATAGQTGGNNIGYNHIGTPTLQTTGTGNITITASSPNGNDTFSRGVVIQGGTVSTTSSGNISFTGTGSDGTGSNCIGVNIVSGTCTATGSGGISFTGTSGAASGTTNYGIYFAGGTVGSAATTGNLTFIADSVTTNSSSRGFSMDTGALIQTSSGNISITGTASAASTTTNGVRLEGSPSIITDSGTVTLVGIVPDVTTGTGVGVTTINANPITSASGDISITGTLGTSINGATSAGVTLLSSWNPSFSSGTPTVTISGTLNGTAGSAYGVLVPAPITLGIGSLLFNNCASGTGAGSHAVGIQANITSTSGNITATNITGGAGSGNAGINLTANITSSLGGNINLTATTNGTGSGVHGIALTGSTISTTGAGTITLNGTSSTGATGSSNGILVQTTSAISSGSGLISLTGVVPSGASGSSNMGITLSSTNPITSSTGGITLSGTSASSGNNGKGLYITGSWTTGTTGTLTFENCEGREGIRIAGAVSTSGDIVATTSILSSTGSGGVAFFIGNNLASSGGDISLTATSQSNGSACHGIELSTGAVSTSGTGAITLNGTASASSSGNSYGVNFSGGSISTSGSGTISVTGSVPNAATGQNSGVNFGTTNGITSSSGDITLTGTTGSGSTTAGSHGIVLANAWNPGFVSGTPTVTLTGSSGNGDSSHGVQVGGALTMSVGSLLFNNCSSGTGAASHGVNVGATISTTSGSITATNITSGSGAGSMGFVSDQNITATSGNISISSVSSGSGTGAYGIAIDALTALYQTGSGNITLDGTSGAGTAYGILIDSSGAVLSTANGSISINETSTTETIALGQSTVSVATGSNISFGAPVILLSSLSSISGNGAGTVLFSSTLDGSTSGADDLPISSGAGNITFSDAVGGTTRVGALSLSSSGNISAAAITAASLTQTGAASAVYTGAINTNTATGVSITGSALTLSGTVTTTSAGDVTITNSGLLTIQNTADMTLGGFFLQNGTGSVSTEGNITLVLALEDAPGDDITFSTAVTLVDSISLNTSATNGDIIFLSTIDGSIALVENLSMNAGSGNIAISGAVGSTTRIGSFSVANCTNLTTSNITAASITQTAGIGTTSFGGALNTVGNIQLTGNIFNINGPVTTTNNGTVVIANAGLLTIASSADMNLDGSFTQNGVGAVSTGGDITTTNDDISFLQNVTLTSGVSLDSGSGLGDITFSGNIDGTFAFSADAGAGSIGFNGTIGGGTVLDSISITGASITVDGAHNVQSGPMIYDGPVTLLSTGYFSNNGAGQVLFTNKITGNYDLTILATSASLTVQGDVTLSGADGVTGVNSGDLSCTTSGTITFGGEILTQGGAGSGGAGGLGGAVTLQSNNGSISVHNINTSGGNGTTLGKNAGNIQLRPTTTATAGLPDGIIYLNSDLGGSGNLVASGGSGATSGTGGAITLSGSRTSSVTVATIVSSLAGNDVSILGGNLVLGANEVMTVLGDIDLQLDSGITIGDVVALQSLSMLSTTINLLTHGNIDILDNTGALVTSNSAHFVAGGATPTVTGTLTPSGPVDIQGLSLLPTSFEPLLLFGSTILNYDPVDVVIPETIVSPPPSTERAVNFLLVADAELTDLLPPVSFYPYEYARFCKKKQKCDATKPSFFKSYRSH